MPDGRARLLRVFLKPALHVVELAASPADRILTSGIEHPDIKPFSSILKVVKKKDILLHFPYHTFNHVVDFLCEAAIDPKVTDISISLYRTADHSRVINALVNAAQNGKKVTVFVELMARFDEERNVRTIDILHQAGVCMNSVTARGS